MTRYGARRHSLKVESSSVDTTGIQPARTWTQVYASVPAEVFSVSANEQEIANGKRRQSLVTFETPFLDSMNSSYRVTWLQYTRVFAVNAVYDPDGMRRVLRWECEEVL